jgi:tetratricopeptide (TPR) repeat protein
MSEVIQKEMKQKTGNQEAVRHDGWKQRGARIAPYFLVFLAGCGLYLHTLQYPLESFDEPNIIGENLPFISNLSNVKDAFMRDALYSPNGKQQFYRPLQNISFMVDAQIGQGKPYGFRIMSLLFHCLTCSVLYHLLRTLKFNRTLSTLIALVFTLHPVFVQVAIWIPSRGDIFITLFGMLALIFFIRYVETRHFVYAFLHVAVFCFALFSKETAVVFPVILLSYYFVMRPKRPISILFIPLAGEVVGIVTFLLLRNTVIKEGVGSQVFGLGPLFSNLAMIPEIVSKYFLPFHGLSPMPVYSIVTTISGIILLLGLIALVNSLKFDRTSKGQILFFALWFLIFLIPGMMYRQTLTVHAYHYLHQRTYLPLIGIAVISCRILAVIPWKRLLPVALIYLAGCISVSYSYSLDYRNAMDYYDAIIKANPVNAYAYYNRGVWKDQRGDMRGALNDYILSMSVAPDFTKPIFNRGFIYYKLRNYDSALIYNNELIRREPNWAEPYNGRGVIESDRRQYGAALEDFNKAISLDGAFENAYGNRAAVFTALGKFDDARRDYETIIKLRPTDTSAMKNLNNIKTLQAGKSSTAQLQVPRLSVDAQKQNEMGVRIAMAGNLRGALGHFTEAIRLNSTYADAYANRGNAKYALHDTVGAIDDWNRAVSFGNREVQTMLNRLAKH